MEERNGHVIWGSWSFDYVVADTEGLCLINGFFRGRYIFNKMSLPVIRVKYTRDEDLAHNPVFGNGCGPYADRIEWDPEARTSTPSVAPIILSRSVTAATDTSVTEQQRLMERSGLSSAFTPG
jgi:Copper amine oxidase, enzyme domain